MRAPVLAVVASLIGSVMATAAPVQAAELITTSDGVSRACDDVGILERIGSKFRHQVTNVPHLPDVEIVAFHRVQQKRYVPSREGRPFARRYCGATATMSDGKKRKVWYLIEDRMGYAGVGDGVEFCVPGFDRWKVYDAYCRIVR